MADTPTTNAPKLLPVYSLATYEPDQAVITAALGAAEPKSLPPLQPRTTPIPTPARVRGSWR